jgi:hypothetical protein
VTVNVCVVAEWDRHRGLQKKIKRNGIDDENRWRRRHGVTNRSHDHGQKTREVKMADSPTAMVMVIDQNHLQQ